MKKRLGQTLLPIMLIAICALARAGPGAPADSREYEIKAAYIFNFAKFVEWPAHTGGPAFVIGVVGSDPIEPALSNAVAGKRVDGRPIAVARFSSAVEYARSPQPVDLLFIALPPESIGAALLASNGKPVLTIAESEGFCERGGIINFVIRKNRIRFEVNPRAAGRAGLRMSSRLLDLAIRTNE